MARLLDVTQALADEQAWVLAVARELAEGSREWTPELRERLVSSFDRLGGRVKRFSGTLPP